MNSTFRQRIEHGFESLGHLIALHRWKTLFALLLLTASLLSQLPRLTMDTSTEGFLHPEDPVLLDYNAFRDQFGRDEMIFIAIQSKGDLFQQPFLKKLKQLHDELKESVPHLDDITSLINARNTRGEANSLIVEDLLENWPQNAAQLNAIKQRAMQSQTYKNFLLSEKGDITAIALKTNAYSDEGQDQSDALAGFDDDSSIEKERKFLTDAENSELVNAVREITTRYQSADFKIYLAGSPVVSNDLKRDMQSNMKRFMGLAFLTIALILLLLFRRLSGVVLPMLTVFLSLGSTLGLMALLQIPFKLPTQIMPSFLLAVGVGASVHVLSIFFRQLQQHYDQFPPQDKTTARQQKAQAIADTLGHSGLPIAMTSLTTAAGLASFSGAEVAPISDLGIIASLGVLVSLLFSLTLLPALLALLPIKAKKSSSSQQRHQRMDQLLTGIAHFSVQRSRLVLIISAVLITIGLLGAAQMRFSHKPYEWFPKEDPIRQATDFLNTEMRGASSVEIIVDTQEENGLYDPQRMASLERLGKELEQINQGELFIGKTSSLADILKETNRALNENQQSAYRIPEDRQLIAQELLLFENSGSDDLEDFVDSQFSKARLTAKMPWVDSVLYGDFLDDLRQRFQSAFGDDVNITITGLTALLGRTMHATIVSMSESYMIAFGVITLMMILLIGDLKLGLISMIPNLAPIILTLGLMGWFDLPMDLFTILIGSIAIGLAVDDTIHFMHNYRRYHQGDTDVQTAVTQTLLGAGRAMLVTTLVLASGFFLYMFSDLSNLFNFGLLTGFTIIMALLADFFLAPALMAELHKRR
ncbi:MAG: efflux RND transporter permease subunit [Gammaproteobacteria bacterium]|nr:efflux RND transporter permease subunit [Gammaproteobacteria bacterium]